jgi:hypothetical protein
VRWTGAWIVLAVAVAACTPVDSKTIRPDAPWYRTVVEPTQSDADRIARFYDRLLTMKGNALAGELEMVRESFEKDKSDLNRLQLALLLSLPGASFRDDNAAIALLLPFTKDKDREGSTLRPLAIWLHSELLELRRAEETWQQQAAKLKDEQRRTEDILQQQAAKLKEEQHRAEALQQKLEAILDMELKMIEREQNLPKNK